MRLREVLLLLLRQYTCGVLFGKAGGRAGRVQSKLEDMFIKRIQLGKLQAFDLTTQSFDTFICRAEVQLKWGKTWVG